MLWKKAAWIMAGSSSFCQHRPQACENAWSEIAQLSYPICAQLTTKPAGILPVSTKPSPEQQKHSAHLCWPPLVTVGTECPSWPCMVSNHRRDREEQGLQLNPTPRIILEHGLCCCAGIYCWAVGSLPSALNSLFCPFLIWLHLSSSCQHAEMRFLCFHP